MQLPHPPSESEFERERNQPPPSRPPFPTIRSPAAAAALPASETLSSSNFSSLGSRTGTLGALSSRAANGAQVQVLLLAFNEMNAEAERIGVAQLSQKQRASYSYAQAVAPNAAAAGNRPRARTGSTSFEDSAADASEKKHQRRESYDDAMQVELGHPAQDEAAQATGSMEEQSGGVWIETRSKAQRKKARQLERLLAAGPNLAGNEASQGDSGQGSTPNVAKLPSEPSLPTHETRSHHRSGLAIVTCNTQTVEIQYK